jgi:hypothetical protein
MSDSGFFLGFFLIILFLALTVGDDGQGIFSTKSSSTPSYEQGTGGSEPTYTTPKRNTSSADEPTYSPADTLTPEEVEDRVANIYRDLDELKEEVREVRLRTPASPYSEYIYFSRGNTGEKNPDREYLTLSVKSNAPGDVNISDWYLESYVTDKMSGIPHGDRVIERWRSPVPSDIILSPGEYAYLITGEAPLNTSFKENVCTGYLNDEADFYPQLGERCPYPLDELERYGKIELDNDKCYEFVERMSSCTTPNDEDYSKSRVGGACSTFIEQTFNYNDCVAIHKDDPYFNRDGYWYVYLGRSRELWRSEREIIRLFDANDRVVAFIEY